MTRCLVLRDLPVQSNHGNSPGLNDVALRVTEVLHEEAEDVESLVEVRTGSDLFPVPVHVTGDALVGTASQDREKPSIRKGWCDNFLVPANRPEEVSGHCIEVGQSGSVLKTRVAICLRSSSLRFSRIN
jgi:hypothetical protein